MPASKAIFPTTREMTNIDPRVQNFQKFCTTKKETVPFIQLVKQILDPSIVTGEVKNVAKVTRPEEVFLKRFTIKLVPPSAASGFSAKTHKQGNKQSSK